MNSLEEKRKARFKFLNLLYEKTGGNRILSESMWELGEELAFERSFTEIVVQYLDGESLLEYTSIGGFVGITHYGIKEVEQAISHPDQPSQYFPPVNIINIQNMVGSQIQQGTVSSTQSADFNSQQLNDINSFISKLKEELPTLTLTEEDRSEIETDIVTIEAQNNCNRPKASIVKECLNSIGRILENVSSSIVAQQLMQSLPSLISGL